MSLSTSEWAACSILMGTVRHRLEKADHEGLKRCTPQLLTW